MCLQEVFLSKYKELSKELQKQIEDDLYNEALSGKRMVLNLILGYIQGQKEISIEPFKEIDLNEKWSEIKKHIKKT